MAEAPVLDRPQTADTRPQLGNERAGLTPHHAARLIFFSYMVAQGSTDTEFAFQQSIFSYLHEQHPDWKISDEDKSTVFEETKKLVDSFHGAVAPNADGSNSKTQHPQIDSKYDKYGDLQKNVDNMQATFNGEAQVKEPLRQILLYTILQDHTILVEKGGRKRSNPDPNDPRRDPWLSFLVHYGLQGNSIGVPEYNQMFRDVRSYIEARGSIGKTFHYLPQIGTMYREVIDVHNQHHPNAQVKPEQFA